MQKRNLIWQKEVRGRIWQKFSWWVHNWGVYLLLDWPDAIWALGRDRYCGQFILDLVTRNISISYSFPFRQRNCRNWKKHCTGAQLWIWGKLWRSNKWDRDRCKDNSVASSFEYFAKDGSSETTARRRCEFGGGATSGTEINQLGTKSTSPPQILIRAKLIKLMEYFKLD